jgi:hypothetical protein
MNPSSYDLELYDLDIEVPDWVDGDITVGTVESIYQAGCSSGAYMPAVTYHEAMHTMSECGDDVVDYLVRSDWDGEIRIEQISGWAGMACHLLTLAVEIWAGEVWDSVLKAVKEREAEDEEEDDDDEDEVAE